MSSFIGKNPNGLNQVSSSVISLYVSGSAIINASPLSVSVVNGIPLSASTIETSIIETPSTGSLTINSNVLITGSVSASLFQGDGSGLFNIQASSIGDINQLKSGSAVANISPNRGLQINVPTSISGAVYITGSTIMYGDLNISGVIQAQELHTTIISSSVVYSSGSNKFGDALVDKHEFTGSVSISGSISVTGDSIQLIIQPMKY